MVVSVIVDIKICVPVSKALSIFWFEKWVCHCNNTIWEKESAVKYER